MSPAPWNPSGSSSLEDRLRKSLAQYTQYQYLALMPAWLPAVLRATDRTSTPPGREGAVAAFHAILFVIGVVTFAFMRWRIAAMKKRLIVLEAQRRSQPPHVPPPPPISAP